MKIPSLCQALNVEGLTSIQNNRQNKFLLAFAVFKVTLTYVLFHLDMASRLLISYSQKNFYGELKYVYNKKTNILQHKYSVTLSQYDR